MLAIATTGKDSQRKLGSEPVVSYRTIAAAYDFLNSGEGLFAYQWHVLPRMLLARPRVLDNPSVERIAQHIVYALLRDRSSVPRAPAPRRQKTENLRLGIGTGCIFLPRLLEHP